MVLAKVALQSHLKILQFSHLSAAFGLALLPYTRVTYCVFLCVIGLDLFDVIANGGVELRQILDRLLDDTVCGGWL